MLLTEYLCQQVRLLMLIRVILNLWKFWKMLLLPLFMALVVLMVLSWWQPKKVKRVELLLIMMAHLVLVSWIQQLIIWILVNCWIIIVSQLLRGVLIMVDMVTTLILSVIKLYGWIPIICHIWINDWKKYISKMLMELILMILHN